MDEDENPQKGRPQPYIMQNFSQNQERARSITQAEPYHLHESQNHCENMKTRHEDLDEGDKQ